MMARKILAKQGDRLHIVARRRFFPGDAGIVAQIKARSSDSGAPFQFEI
jgi:hypothetical protein